MLRPASTLCLPLRGEGGTAIAVTDEVGCFCLRDAVHLISLLRFAPQPASPHRGSLGDARIQSLPRQREPFVRCGGAKKTEIVLAFLRGMCYNNNENHY